MGIEEVPVRVPMIDQNGMMTDAWREWFESLRVALNNTSTLDVVTDIGPPQVLTEITYVDGS